VGSAPPSGSTAELEEESQLPNFIGKSSKKKEDLLMTSGVRAVSSEHGVINR
jgi:hypothetical protein